MTTTIAGHEHPQNTMNTPTSTNLEQVGRVQRPMPERGPQAASTRPVTWTAKRPEGRAHYVYFGSALLAAGLLLSGCSRETDSTPAGVLAEVNGRPISEASFRQGWEGRPPAQDTPENRERWLQRLIQRSALAQAAQAAGLDEDPQVIEQFENLLINRLRETQLQPELAALQAPETEVRASYDANRAGEFAEPERRRVAVIWLNTRGQAPLEERYTPRLNEIRAASAKGEHALPTVAGFGEHALASEHRASRFNGGDLGWVEDHSANDAWLSAVWHIAKSLTTPGEVSPVVANEHGLFLVRLIERKAAHVREYESVKAAIERRLLTERQRATEEAFNERILSRAAVRRFPERLEALDDLPVAEALAGDANRPDPSFR